MLITISFYLILAWLSFHNWWLQNLLQDHSIDKCNTITVSRNKSSIFDPYNIIASNIGKVSIIDSSVRFHYNLTFRTHVANVVGNAFQTSGFILRRSLDLGNIEILKTIYYSLLRTICNKECNPNIFRVFIIRMRNSWTFLCFFNLWMVVLNDKYNSKHRRLKFCTDFSRQ